MLHIIYDPRAIQDLDDIWRYIAMDHIKRADLWIDNIERSIRKIADQPGIGKSFFELGDGIRGKSIEKYLILYKVTKEGIEVFRIIHGARDLKKVWDV